MKLALDHHYSTAIAVQMRQRGHDVVAAVEAGWDQLGDAELLAACYADRRALLTNKVSDLMALLREREASGEHHTGLIFTSDRSLPRSRATVGTFVSSLAALLTAEPNEFTDRVWWLHPPRRDAGTGCGDHPAVG